MVRGLQREARTAAAAEAAWLLLPLLLLLRRWAPAGCAGGPWKAGAAAAGAGSAGSGREGCMLAPPAPCTCAPHTKAAPCWMPGAPCLPLGTMLLAAMLFRNLLAMAALLLEIGVRGGRRAGAAALLPAAASRCCGLGAAGRLGCGAAPPDRCAGAVTSTSIAPESCVRSPLQRAEAGKFSAAASGLNGSLLRAMICQLPAMTICRAPRSQRNFQGAEAAASSRREAARPPDRGRCRSGYYNHANVRHQAQRALTGWASAGGQCVRVGGRTRGSQRRVFFTALSRSMQ
jgi:hypothetical protein